MYFKPRMFVSLLVEDGTYFVQALRHIIQFILNKRPHLNNLLKSDSPIVYLCKEEPSFQNSVTFMIRTICWQATIKCCNTCTVVQYKLRLVVSMTKDKMSILYVKAC